MSKPFDVSEHFVDFTGRAPLFPLPNGVFFPHLLLPLHIFEPRYRQMAADALAGNRLIAMALLRPGWTTSEGFPAIHEIVCVGRITADQRLPDGRYYLVLQGLARAHVLREETTGQPYRVADLELCPEAAVTVSETAADAQRRRLLGAFRKLFSKVDLDRILRRALDEAVHLGILCDVLADAMGLEPQSAYEVLSELDVNRRCQLVLRLIHEQLRSRIKPVRTGWPPEFSLN